MTFSFSNGSPEGTDIRIPAGQLALRFALEIGSLIAIGHYVGRFFAGVWVYLAGFGAAAVIAAIWGICAVKGDPSRSGNAPVPVPGAVRLALELAVFLSGAAALAATQNWILCGLFLAAFAIHHAMTTARLAWLLRH